MQILTRVRLRIREAITVLRHAHDDIKQCRGALKKDDSYCATGVLAKHWGWRPRSDTHYTESLTGEIQLLDTANNEHIGYAIVRGKMTSEIIDKIIEKNDSGFTFNEIADELEKMIK